VLVLRSDLSVEAFGDSAGRQTKLPEAVTRPGSVKAVAAGKFHSLALTVDGNVVQWGRANAGVPPPATQSGNIVSIFAGDASSCALSVDGNVYCWGESIEGSETKPVTQALPTELSGMTGLRDIRVTPRNGWMALFNNGTLLNYTVTDGETLPTTPQVVEGVAQLAVSLRSLPIHSVVLFRNGSSVGWGRDSSGQATRPAREVKDAIKVAAGIDTVRCACVAGCDSLVQCSDRTDAMVCFCSTTAGAGHASCDMYFDPNTMLHLQFATADHGAVQWQRGAVRLRFLHATQRPTPSGGRGAWGELRGDITG
jgi:alpha-tubulin suppressor-like RCC1 family protein